MKISEAQWEMFAKVLQEIGEIEEEANKILKEKKKRKSILSPLVDKKKKRKKSSKSKCSGGL
jgi:hypothetical protein